MKNRLMGISRNQGVKAARILTQLTADCKQRSKDATGRAIDQKEGMYGIEDGRCSLLHRTKNAGRLLQVIEFGLLC